MGLKKAYEFFSSGVWKSSKNTVWVRIVKTLNLAFRSFLDRDLQNKSSSLTFNMLLALVPALALLFAIGRGFGLQDLLKDQLFSYFPAQKEAIQQALTFVDSYLNESAQGLFVGIGIIILLYTMISLLSSIEESFNSIWDIKKDRSIYQKVTDYIAICLLIPILMICSAGVSIFMSTVIQTQIHIPFLTPIVNIALELFPLVLVWGAFSLAFWLIPNTKVKFKYAAISGIISAIGFQIVELLFLNGQIYVTKYNAIYGSFAFLPLLLVWMQFSWIILLAGCTLTYCLQNVFAYNYMTDTQYISNNYMRKVTLVVSAAIVQRFAKGETPLSTLGISQKYSLPVRLVNKITSDMHDNGLVNYVELDNGETGIAPSADISDFTAGDLIKRLDNAGDSDFIPHFDETYKEVIEEVDKWNGIEWEAAGKTLIKDIPLPPPTESQSKS